VRHICFWLGAFLALIVSSAAFALPDSFADLAEQQRQSVVNISTTKVFRHLAGS